MKEKMKPKGFISQKETDPNECLFYDIILNSRGVITFAGDNISEFSRVYQDPTDDHLSRVVEEGLESNFMFYNYKSF